MVCPHTSIGSIGIAGFIGFTGATGTTGANGTTILTGTGTSNALLVMNDVGDIIFKNPTHMQGITMVDSLGLCWKLRLDIVGNIVTKSVVCP